VLARLVAACLVAALGPGAAGQQGVVTGPTFEPDASSSVDVTASTFATEFADGSALSGTLASDAVQIGSVSSGSDRGAEFGLGDASAATGRWHHSGILGLGVQSSGVGIPSLLEAMLPRADERRFAVALDTGGGRLWVGPGASDPAALGVTTSELVLQPGVDTEYHDYAVAVQSIAVGGDGLTLSTSGAPHPACRVDTGASALILPAVAFEQFEALLHAHTGALPSITVTIGGEALEIPAAQWNLPGVGVAVTTDVALPEYCALGAPFLRTVLALFDASSLPPRVGFAPRLRSDEDEAGRRRLNALDREETGGGVRLVAMSHDAVAAAEAPAQPQLPQQQQRRRQQRRRRLQGVRGAVLLDALESLQYFVPVMIGTPSQGPFLLQLDTGSGLMVVMAEMPAEFPIKQVVLVGVALLMVGAVAWSSCYSGDGDAQQQQQQLEQQQLELEQQQQEELELEQQAAAAAEEESVASASSRAGEGRETLKGGVP
jgi:hypothetical protein